MWLLQICDLNSSYVIAADLWSQQQLSDCCRSVISTVVMWLLQIGDLQLCDCCRSVISTTMWVCCRSVISTTMCVCCRSVISTTMCVCYRSVISTTMCVCCWSVISTTMCVCCRSVLSTSVMCLLQIGVHDRATPASVSMDNCLYCNETPDGRGCKASIAVSVRVTLFCRIDNFHLSQGNFLLPQGNQRVDSYRSNCHILLIEEVLIWCAIDNC